MYVPGERNASGFVGNQNPNLKVPAIAYPMPNVKGEPCHEDPGFRKKRRNADVYGQTR
jgi:hypothetical protein